MVFDISAMAIIFDEIESDSKENAIDTFCANCPYDIDGSTIYVEEKEKD